MNILISWVFTLWLFLFYFQAYETLKECDWTKEDHYRIMKMCVWPLLNPQTSDKESNQQQYQYLSKTVDLFKCWIRHYTNLFFLEVSIFLLLCTYKNTVLLPLLHLSSNSLLFQEFNVSSWICHSILESNIVEANFKETILNVTCSLVFEIGKKIALNKYNQFTSICF